MNNMEKENHENGEDLPTKLKQVKENIQRGRFLHINEALQRNIPNVEAYVSQHQSLALTRSNGYDHNSSGSGNNLLSSRMQNPIQHFNGRSTTVLALPVVELPFVEQLPNYTTWVFTDRNQLMTQSDYVTGKKQIYSVNGETVEFIEEDEETDKEKFEFSEDVDRIIWKIGQEHNLNDLIVQSALSKFLKLDGSHILERYNDIKNLKNQENVGEASDSRSHGSLFTSFSKTVDKHFCRRCLIFGCGMHENSQLVIEPREKKIILPEIEDVRKQCSEHCYLKVNKKRKIMFSDTNTETEDCVMTDTNNWTLMEKDLYLKGVEIFGKNSCFITRNLLSGLKTCLEVYYYMCEQDQCLMKSSEHNQTEETEDNHVNKEVPQKDTKSFGKKRKLRKYAQYPTALKNIAKGENKIYKQYNPCTCESVCGDQCTCLTNGNCCEKYCGCSKICNNRFGGCNCSGQCITRQCPCFAANRECDPDICKNCWLSCGDGSLGETSEESKCKNMQFLLKKHKRILLGKSDIHGWGAFAGDPLKKNEFIGEYTGELIYQDEANERGKVDDLFGSSYLFNLNDKLEIDGRRKGNKLRFLNHSSKPNCYSKVVIMRGDHKIGIFANKAIKEGDELCFNYRYEPGQADWS